MRKVAVVLALALVGVAAFFLLRGDPVGPRERSSPVAKTTALAGPTAPLNEVPSEALPPEGVAVEIADGEPSRLMGVVRSTADGSPVPGAELSFSHSGSVHTEVTGPDGRFALATLEPGRYVLAAASAPGFLPFAPEWGRSPVAYTARRGESVTGVRIDLAPAVPIEVLVLDEQRKPITGAQVQLLGVENVDRLVAVQSRFETDSLGRVQVTPPDGQWIEARHPDFASARGEVDDRTRLAKRLTLTLTRTGQQRTATGPVEGRVLGPGKQPVEGAEVWIESLGDDATIARTKTDETGGFAFAEVTEPVRIRAASSGLAPTSLEPVQPGTKNVKLMLRGGGAIAGQVTFRGAPQVAFTVVVGLVRGPLEIQQVRNHTVYDAAGRYRVDNLQSGTYRVTVLARNLAPAQQDGVDVQSGAVRELDFTLNGGGAVRGVVRDSKSKAPLARAKITVEGPIAVGRRVHSAMGTATTNADGTFVIRGLSPGRRSLVATADGHHQSIASGLDVIGDETIGPITVELAPLAPGEKPRLELAGIGAILGPGKTGLIIRRAIVGGGAADAGLVAGDEVVRVNGAAVVDLGFGGTIEQIRGPVGTTVTLGVIRQGAENATEIAVQRKKVRT